MNEYIREEELSRKLSLSRSTLYSLRRHGLPFRRIGGVIRYSPEEVEAWLTEHCQGQEQSETRLEVNSL